MQKTVLLAGVFVLSALIGVEAADTGTKPVEVVQCDADKITFDLGAIDQNGLIGPVEGKVRVDYEFCIPYEEQYLKEVQAIDPDINCNQGPGGRIGCGEAEYLCLGNTHKNDFEKVLCRLSALVYIKRIDQCFWE